MNPLALLALLLLLAPAHAATTERTWDYASDSTARLRLDYPQEAATEGSTLQFAAAFTSQSTTTWTAIGGTATATWTWTATGCNLTGNPTTTTLSGTYGVQSDWHAQATLTGAECQGRLRFQLSIDATPVLDQTLPFHVLSRTAAQAVAANVDASPGTLRTTALLLPLYLTAGLSALAIRTRNGILYLFASAVCMGTPFILEEMDLPISVLLVAWSFYMAYGAFQALTARRPTT